MCRREEIGSQFHPVNLRKSAHVSDTSAKISPMPLTYFSGEEIRSGDHILYHGEPGHVEFVAAHEDPETVWYVEQFGGGCMILAPSFGSVFISEADEDLEFVARNTRS
jgi:hypothetical protein